MDVETGPMRSLLRKLEKLLTHEYNLQNGVRRQVIFLKVELENRNAFLSRIAEEPPEMVDEQDRTWARKMREASYDIEDVIDPILVSFHACSEPTDLGRSRLVKRALKKMGVLPSKAMAHGDIAASIEEAKKKLLEMDKLVRRYNRGMEMPVAATSNAVDPRLPALYRKERELVGIEEARDDLIRLLTQGDAEDDRKQELMVVSIVGLGGVGKTTLAKAVYNRLQQQFDCSAFVSVSWKPDLKKVLMGILLELDEAKYHTGITAKTMNERQLIEEIRGFLKDKRYLIVVDDIWDPRAWEIIGVALHNNHPGSRIITTTRSSDVAAMVGAAKYILKPLSHPNSEKLFYKRIFGGEGNCPDIKLAQVSDKILKECSGLPLAIITVASMLASKPPVEWAEVYNSMALRHKSNRFPNFRAFQSCAVRVLALEYCPGMNTNHLKMIGKLVHLRYLGLVGAGVLELPEETLRDLRFLQTLDLRETDIEQWPSAIPKLHQLMCLCVRRARAVAAGMVGTLGSLEYLRLQLVSGDSSKLIAELGRLERLRVLVLGLEKMDVELEKALLESLYRLPKIQRLEIYCELMAAASDEQEPHITTVVGSSDHAFSVLNFFSTNMAVRFDTGIGEPPMPNLGHVNLHVRVAQCVEPWLSNLGLACLKSLYEVTVALDGRGASAAEIEEAEEKLRRRATSVHPNPRLRLEVTKQNGNDEVPLIEQFRFKDPRFEDLRSKMEKMQANRQVQVQPDNDSDEEITPAYAASEY